MPSQKRKTTVEDVMSWETDDVIKWLYSVSLLLVIQWDIIFVYSSYCMYRLFVLLLFLYKANGYYSGNSASKYCLALVMGTVKYIPLTENRRLVQLVEIPLLMPVYMGAVG